MLVNGVVSESIPINDRGLSYGDGLFETIKIHQGRAIYLEQHLQRLKDGCQRLNINLPLLSLKQDIIQLQPQFNKFDIVKIIITRGTGGRGYRSSDAEANRYISLHNLPTSKESSSEVGIHAFLCQQTLARQPVLAGMKHLNRLEQVLASQEWPSEKFQEGLMLDTQNNLIEGTKSNIFIVKSGEIITPALGQCGVDGIMRQVLIKALTNVQIKQCSIDDLLNADEAFVCNSVFGIWPIVSLQTNKGRFSFTAGSISQKAKSVFEHDLQQNAS